VVPEEAEDVAAAEPVARATDTGRYHRLGRTLAGRMLTVLGGPAPNQPDVYDVVSARPASRHERRFSAHQNGGYPHEPTQTNR
jgi:hypothetical protein